MRLILIFLVGLPLIFFPSCQPDNKKTIKEGFIKYDISYPNEEKYGFKALLLPGSMTTHFEKNMVRNTFKAGKGYRFSLITNSKKDYLIGLFELSDKKYYYIEDENVESSVFYDALPGIVITPAKETKKIAGHTSHSAIVKSDRNDFEPYTIWFTKSIKINRPNHKNPYESMDAMLTDFRLNLYNIDMHFTAKKIKKQKINKEIFEIPPGYQRINKSSVKKLLSLLDH